MFVHQFKNSCRLLLLPVFAGYLFAATGTASALELFYENFDDTTLATGASQQSGTIANGIISYNDTSATNRARFVDVQNLTDPVMTFSWDVVAPVTIAGGQDHELTFRAGPATAANTLSSTEFVMEVIAFRTTGLGTAGGPRAPYVNNGNESIFVVANNQPTSLNFSSPVDASSVTLTANQYISYVHNKTADTWGTLKAATNYSTPTTGAGAGSLALQRFGIGSSSNAHQGTFGLDNVRVVTGVDFVGSVPPIPGDVNGDGFVLIDDFDIIKDNFRKSPRARAQGDLTADGLVSLPDFKQWKGAFIAGSGSTVDLDFGFLNGTVPEPSSGLIAIFGMFGLMCRRWRRTT